MELAATLDLLGCIYLSLGDVEAAFNNFEEALNLRLKYLSNINPNHPDIGVSYHNIGRATSKTAEFRKAKQYYVKAAEIYRHNFPDSNPLVQEITNCLTRTSQ